MNNNHDLAVYTQIASDESLHEVMVWNTADDRK